MHAGAGRHQTTEGETNVKYRKFGKTDMDISEVGFGAWGIGGAYGELDPKIAISALSRAEELGCNFVDTAGVYGTSEEVLGQFLPSRKDRWYVATKYSGQPEGLIAKAESQLKTMGIDVIDFYQVHWAPTQEERELWDSLYELKTSGKARYVGVSLHWPEDIDNVLDNEELDGFQVAHSLLDPHPFRAKLGRIQEAGIGILCRSSLRNGFLTGKFKATDTFDDPIRSSFTEEQIRETVEAAEHFRFLEETCGSMAIGAARFCLSYDVVSSLLLGTKTPEQADINFGQVPGEVLDEDTMAKIKALDEMVYAFDEKHGRKRKK